MNAAAKMGHFSAHSLRSLRLCGNLAPAYRRTAENAEFAQRNALRFSIHTCMGRSRVAG